MRLLLGSPASPPSASPRSGWRACGARGHPRVRRGGRRGRGHRAARRAGAARLTAPAAHDALAARAAAGAHDRRRGRALRVGSFARCATARPAGADRRGRTTRRELRRALAAGAGPLGRLRGAGRAAAAAGVLDRANGPDTGIQDMNPMHRAAPSCRPCSAASSPWPSAPILIATGVIDGGGETKAVVQPGAARRSRRRRRGRVGRRGSGGLTVSEIYEAKAARAWRSSRRACSGPPRPVRHAASRTRATATGSGFVLDKEGYIPPTRT